MSGAGDGILREDGPGGGRWMLREGGAEAEMTFSRSAAARIVVDHTAVPEALRGRGAGLRLAGRMVADARAEGLSVVALCPFVKAQARRHPDWADVIE